MKHIKEAEKYHNTEAATEPFQKAYQKNVKIKTSLFGKQFAPV